MSVPTTPVQTETHDCSNYRGHFVNFGSAAHAMRYHGCVVPELAVCGAVTLESRKFMFLGLWVTVCNGEQQVVGGYTPKLAMRTHVIFG